MCLHWENEAGTHIFDSQDWFKMWLVNNCLQDQLQAFIWPFSFHKPVYIWHHPVHSQVFSSWTGQKWCNRLSKPFKQEKRTQFVYQALQCVHTSQEFTWDFCIPKSRGNTVIVSSYSQTSNTRGGLGCVIHDWGCIESRRIDSVAHFVHSVLPLLFSPHL